MREMTPVALLRAVRHGNVGLFTSNLTVIIGNVLTIVISNLWIQEAATAYIDMKAPVSNTWNSQWDDNAFDDGGASTVLNNVQPNGVGSPDTATWNDIVIPSFGKVKAFNDTQSIFKSRTSDQAFDFILNVSALRPRLFCDVQTSQVSLPKPESDTTSFTANAEFPVPSECGTEIQQGQRSTISFAGVGDNSTQWAGFLLDLHMGYNMTKTCPSCTTSPIVTLPDRFKGCPYVGVLFGKPTDGISALLCTQTIQQVEVNLRFQSAIGPNGVFDLRRSKLTSSPVINESLTTNLTGSDTRMEAFSYRVQSHFDKNLTIGSPDDQADPFFQYIILRSSTANITELSQDRNFLVATVNKVYSDYMVQVIDSPIFRRPADSAHEGVVNGTISRETTLLFMNHNAKIILQVSLGSMVVFGLTAFLLVDLRAPSREVPIR
ncbi:hypothetical protein CCHR01_04877 [Colletotrichum chrysophilum]|uniref:Transmembrane protein n=1 Tax=Colletotrichum chrysophilum TaxID=1836956 RepID=A0AAD9ELB4_9PEZI|nr:hypothetical protein CCHR01_04877 [Colletotrichum chrysophilum]